MPQKQDKGKWSEPSQKLTTFKNNLMEITTPKTAYYDAYKTLWNIWNNMSSMKVLSIREIFIGIFPGFKPSLFRSKVSEKYPCGCQYHPCLDHNNQLKSRREIAEFYKVCLSTFGTYFSSSCRNFLLWSNYLCIRKL